jgi:hypothetical protein
MRTTRLPVRVLAVAALSIAGFYLVPARAMAQGAFSATDSMTTPRGSHTATRLLDGRVLVACGSNGLSNVNTVELYDPGTDTWSNTQERLDLGGHEHAADLLRPDRDHAVAGHRARRVSAGAPQHGRLPGDDDDGRGGDPLFGLGDDRHRAVR